MLGKLYRASKQKQKTKRSEKNSLHNAIEEAKKEEKAAKQQAEKAEAEFEAKLKRDTQGILSTDLKGLPRLRTVDQYFKEKFEAEILNKIMGQI